MELGNPLQADTTSIIILCAIASTWLKYNKTTAYGDNKLPKVNGHDPQMTLLKFAISSLPTLATRDNILGASFRIYLLPNSPFGNKIDISLDKEWMNTRYPG